MIIIASQRGGAAKLAAHLMNDHDNEHVELYEVSGFMADTLPEALQEARAQSMGTRCNQYLFSVSLNPPATEKVGTEVFKQAIDRIEERMNLQDQPRVIVFHEKAGRRHAHCVWSRIDTTEMKAINLPFYKSRLMEISKEIHLEQDWKLPAGLIERGQSALFATKRSAPLIPKKSLLLKKHHHCYMRLCSGNILPDNSDDIYRKARKIEFPLVPNCRQCKIDNPKYYAGCIKKIFPVHRKCHGKIHKVEKYLFNKLGKKLLSAYARTSENATDTYGRIREKQ